MSIEPRFIPTITNDQTAALPAIRFDGETVVVDTDAQLADACKYLAGQSVIGFDTETRPSFKAGVTNRVALLQLSTYERCYLIRLCRVRFSRELLRIMESASIKKVGADVAGDIRSLNQLKHFRADGFLDVQTLAPQWGIEDKSLRKISAIVLGKRVSKAQRLSNWEAAQLTEQQMAYAATDAWVCLKILDALNAVPAVCPAPAQPEKPIADEEVVRRKRRSRRRILRRRRKVSDGTAETSQENVQVKI